MQTDAGLGAVFIGFVLKIRFAKVELALAHAEQFALEESEAGVGPAGTRAVLVLDAGDGVFLDGRELEAVFLSVELKPPTNSPR